MKLLCNGRHTFKKDTETYRDAVYRLLKRIYGNKITTTWVEGYEWYLLESYCELLLTVYSHRDDTIDTVFIKKGMEDASADN
jgi:hypothetical protein